MKHNSLLRSWMLSIPVILYCLFPPGLSAQTDTLTREQTEKIVRLMKDFTLGFYIDVYYVRPVDNSGDTSNIMPLYANCSYTNAFRLNVASFIVSYHSDQLRGNMTFQYGDIPFLLTSVDAQFIKYLRQANFGIRLSKNSWMDFGYMLNPIGVESSWPVYNYLSTASVGGYFEPGNILGVRFSTQVNPRLGIKVYICNPYSLAYSGDTYVSLGAALEYKPWNKFTVTYANMSGLQSMDINEHAMYRLYNNLIAVYTPLKQLELTGQFDLALQTNSHLAPDTAKLSCMTSGLIQAKYQPLKKWSFSVRGEYFSDPNGFLSGVYDVDEDVSGLKTWGYAGGVEFRPVSKAYVRAEFRYLHANEKIFYDNSRDYQYNLTFTTGILF